MTDLKAARAPAWNAQGAPRMGAPSSIRGPWKGPQPVLIMDFQIALLLVQDGIVNGAVYGLMGLALVLVFSVTRVIFIPQGELVAFAALSMAALNAGGVPRTLWLLLGLAVATLLVEAWRHGAARRWTGLRPWSGPWCFPVAGRRAGAAAAQLAGAAGAHHLGGGDAARARCCTGWPTGRWPMPRC